MEEIIITENLEEIQKFGFANRFDYPVITIGEKTIYFNRFAEHLLKDAVRWATAGEYVIGLPCDRKASNAFAARKPATGAPGKIAVFPSALRDEKKIQPGTYKLYKYKDGFAFKRYEPIKEGKANG